MGKIKNCSECGRLYMEIGQGVCPDCFAKEEEMEKVVYDYVRDHDKCGIKQIVDDTGVKERVILRMLKAGRFVSSGLEVTYPCRSCGAPITEGTMCPKCKNDLLNQAKQLQASKTVRKVDKSHTMYNVGRGK